jgi:hypothetical protein
LVISDWSLVIGHLSFVFGLSQVPTNQPMTNDKFCFGALRVTALIALITGKVLKKRNGNNGHEEDPQK